MIYVPETDYVGTETAVQNYDPSFGFLAKEHSGWDYGIRLFRWLLRWKQ